MKIKLFTTLGLCAAMLACSSDKDENAQTPTQTGSARVNISVGSVSSRADVKGTQKESALHMIEFYVFDHLGNPDKLVGKTETADGDGYIAFDNTNVLNYSFIVTGDAVNAKKFVAVANMNLGKLPAGRNTYNDLRKELSKMEFTITGTHNSRDEDRALGFEMTGAKLDAIIQPDKPNQNVYIPVKRLVSRIDAPDLSVVTVELTDEDIEKLWGENNGVTSVGFEYSTTEGYYAVINGLNRSDAFFSGNAAGDPTLPKTNGGYAWDLWQWNGQATHNAAIKKEYLNSSFNAQKMYTNNYSGNETGSSTWFLSGELSRNGHRVYVHENKPRYSAAGQHEYDAKSVYSFIIKGQLKAAGQESKTRYWKVPIVWDEDYYVLRNCVYEIAVNKIRTIGYDNPKDAEEEPVTPRGGSSVDISVTVSDWTIMSFTDEM